MQNNFTYVNFNLSELELWVDWYSQILNAYNAFENDTTSTIQYWNASFSNDTVDAVISDLTAEGVWDNFTTFFTEFFGANGLVTNVFNP
jgi:hypothetical protein